jgi:hypothetical protein
MRASLRFVAGCAALAVCTISSAQDISKDRAQLVIQIDNALARGGNYLVQQQNDDGYWRSNVYGLLKDGPSLTALALWALPSRDDHRGARNRGFETMRRLLRQENGQWRVVEKLEYPVYTASLMILADRLNFQKGGPAWLAVLREHQFDARNGWTKDDPFFGGWGYTKAPPVKPKDGSSVSPLDEPNLSATAFAVEAIHAVIWEKGAYSGMTIQPESQIAADFVERCQNWKLRAPADDAAFNDGGFHFMLGDSVRNKPGVAGVDSTGATRFRSYGSATADGAWTLLMAKRHLQHNQREVAAQNWLIEHFDGMKHPGNYADDRRSLQPALDYYYARALLRAGHHFTTTNASEDLILRDHRWVERIAKELLERQQPDGSWRNPAVDVREDDPLIATSFALVALRECRLHLATE